MKTEPKKINIQERMQEKAMDAYAEVEYQIDCWMDNKKSDFSMYKYLKQLEYSGKVVTFMKGHTEPALVEVKNEEGCEQLEEAFNFLTKTQKKNYLSLIHI